jgi:hypothetical protein
MQITGRANYREMGKKIGIDLEDDPDLAAQPLYALMTAAAFWDNRGLNGLADRDDLQGITKRVNGGLNGLDHRKSNLASARSIFSQGAAAPRSSGPSVVPRGAGSAAPARPEKENEQQGTPDWMPSAFSGAVTAFAPGPTPTAVVPFRGQKAGSGGQVGYGPAPARPPRHIRAVRDRGRLVLAFGVMFLLAALIIPAGRYVLEASILPGTPWEALVLGFTALVGIASLGFIVLGWKIASTRADEDAAVSARNAARASDTGIQADAA